MILAESPTPDPAGVAVDIQAVELTAIMALMFHGIMAVAKEKPKEAFMGIMVLRDIFSRNKDKIKAFSVHMESMGLRKGLFEEMQRLVDTSCELLRLPKS